MQPTINSVGLTPEQFAALKKAQQTVNQSGLKPLTSMTAAYDPTQARSAGTTPVNPTGMPEITPDFMTPEQFAGVQRAQETVNLSGQTPLTRTRGVLPPQQAAMQAQLAPQGQTLTNFAPGSLTGNGTSTNFSDLEQQYMNNLNPSQEQQDLMNQQIALDNQLKMLQLGQTGTNNALEGQPIARPFITGQQSAVNKDYALQQGVIQGNQQTLQQRLALAQAKQQSALDVSKFQLDRADRAKAAADAQAEKLRAESSEQKFAREMAEAQQKSQREIAGINQPGTVS